MTSKPTELAPSWATDANYTSGSQSGQTTRLEPSSGIKAQGILPDTVASARRHNWLLGSLCDFVSWLANIQSQNWTLVGTDSAFTSDSIPTELLANSSYVYQVGTIPDGSTQLSRSRHGDIWTNVTPSGLGINTVRHCLSYGGAVLLMGGDGATIGNNIRRSTNDGTTWSTIACHTGANGYHSIAYDGAAFYATPADTLSNSPGKSTNGSSWAATAGSIPSGSEAWTAVALTEIRAGTTGNLIIFVRGAGFSHVLFTIDGGATWTESGSVGVGTNQFFDVRYNAVQAAWLAINDLGVYKSIDSGSTWTIVSSQVFGNQSRLETDGGGTYIVVDAPSALVNYVYWSRDGSSWESHPLDSGSAAMESMSVAYGGGRFWAFFGHTSADKLLYRGLKL